METALPITAQVIADVIGTEKALTLARATQCRSVYIPQRLNPDHWLVEVVGTDAAQKLIAEFPSCCLPLAKCSSVVKAKRNKRIAELSAQGLYPTEISRRLGVSRNTVKTILYRMRFENQ